VIEEEPAVEIAVSSNIAAEVDEKDNDADQPVSGNEPEKAKKPVKEKKPDEAVSDNVLTPVSANESAFKMTDKAKNLIAESVASMVLLTGSESYDGPVSNDQMRLWHSGADQYLASSGIVAGEDKLKQLIREPIIYEAMSKEGRITVSGSFVIDNKNPSGVWKSDIYVFTLSGMKDTSEVRYGKIQIDSLKVINVSHNQTEEKKSVSENEKHTGNSVSVNDSAPVSVSGDTPDIVEDGETVETSLSAPMIVDFPSDEEFQESLNGVPAFYTESASGLAE
jgi:hypothetical protein